MALKIGSVTLANSLILAPLAGITNLPFRRLVREYGASLAFTEMVSSHGLTRGSGKSLAYLDSREDDRPLGVQLFGSDPQVMAEAAIIAADRGAHLLDINMGCPVRKVIKTGAGAALLTNPPLAERIIRAVRKATSLPLTVKIRSGWDRNSINAVEIGQMAEINGVDAITVHARTAKDGFSCRADWQVIGSVKSRLKIPVIGNGDIRSGTDVLKMREETGCDGFMIGRGVLGNPWIFLQSVQALAGDKTAPVTLVEREKVLWRHYRLHRDYVGLSQTRRDFLKHLLWYTKGLPGGAELRHRLTSASCNEDICALVSQFFHPSKTRPCPRHTT